MSNLTSNHSSTSRQVYENPTIGDKAVFLKTTRETGGAYSLLEIELAVGGGNPLHAHNSFSETFIPLEGELEVQVGKERKVLKPGQSFTVPPKTPHLFQNPTNKIVKFRVKIEPGHEGFENTVKIGYGLAKDGLTNSKGYPKSFAHAAVLMSFFDPYPTGMLKLMLPILRWKARQAHLNGLEKELLDRYCR